MAVPAPTGRMRPAEFLTWCLHQDEHYELVDGRPRMMTGATQRHDRVVVNAIVALGTKLRGGPCRPTTDDVAVVARNENVRRPDVSVTCEPFEPGSTKNDDPVLVLEVLSPSTARVDQFEKLEEYKQLESLAYILFVEAARPHVVVYVRQPDKSWAHLSHLGLDTVIDLPALSCTLSLAALYEDVPLAADPG